MQRHLAARVSLLHSTLKTNRKKVCNDLLIRFVLYSDGKLCY